MSNFDESSPHASIPSHHTYNQLKKPHQQYYSNRIRLSFPKQSKANATPTHPLIDQTKRVAVFRPWQFLGIACLLLSSAQTPPAFHGCIADHYTCRLGRVSLTNALQNSARHYHLAPTPILRSQVAIAPGLVHAISWLPKHNSSFPLPTRDLALHAGTLGRSPFALHRMQQASLI